MKHLPGFEEARDDCKLLGTELSRYSFDRLNTFATLLAEYSSRTNLVGPSEMPRIWRRHILESIAYTMMLDQMSRVVDIGTGAGFPGLVLAIMGMDVEILEPRKLRARFLKNTAARLGLGRVRVRCTKIENSDPFSDGIQFTARGVGKPSELLEIIEANCCGTFTLTRRYATNDDLPERSVNIALPCPPLDRTGYLVQYRHPDQTRI